MKILVLTDYYPPDKTGGVGEIARGLRDAYRALGHEVLVLTTGRARPEEAREGILRSARGLLAGALLNNLAVLREIRRGGVGLVHLHQSSTTLFLLARPFLGGFPFVLDSLQVSYLSEAREVRAFEVDGQRFRPRFGEVLERLVLAPGHVLLDFLGWALSDRVTAVSEANRAELERSFGRLRRRPVAVVPNGVAPAGEAGGTGTLPFRDEALERRLAGKVVFAYVGVFRARKRVQGLLLAFSRVAARSPDAVLLLVGGGRGYEEELRALAVRLGVAERVVFVGRVPAERVPYYLSLTHVFCLISSYEGMPVALLEAMREGKAVVATDGWGMRDLLAAGDAGVLVPVDDVDATAAALAELAADPERRAALGRRASALVSGRFLWGPIARRYLELAGR